MIKVVEITFNDSKDNEFYYTRTDPKDIAFRTGKKSEEEIFRDILSDDYEGFFITKQNYLLCNDMSRLFWALFCKNDILDMISYCVKDECEISDGCWSDLPF